VDKIVDGVLGVKEPERLLKRRLELLMRFRFSIRVLFVATAIVAAGCYWLMLPTIVAKRFVRAVESADYAAADNCFRDVTDRIFAAYNQKFWTFQLQAALAPSSAAQIWRGERQITFHLAFGGPMPARVHEGTIVATRLGLKSPEITGGISGGFSM
jgi:hypothetical protein